MASRGSNVQYTIPTIAVGNTLQVTPLKTICSIILKNRSEFKGLSVVWSNPDRAGNGQAKDVRLLAAEAAWTTELNAISTALAANGKVPVDSINKIVDYMTTLDTDMKTLFTTNAYTAMSKEAFGNNEVASLYTAIIANLTLISTNLDSVNSYWDANDVCARNCQVSCQAACQLACQSCYGGTCHDQNCGGWS